MTDERIIHKSLPGGAVLLEKELPSPEDLLPNDLKIENIRPEPEDQRRIICQVCNKHGKRVDATALLVPTPNGFVLIPALEIPPDGVQYGSFCAAHAKRTKKILNKRMRQIRRYSTNLYTQER